MSTSRELLRRIRMLFSRRRFEADLEEEMRLHLDLRQQDGIEAGLEERDARRAAYRRFGNVTAMKEKSHMSWGWEWMETLLQDVSYGIRSMLRSPALTIVALLSLGLGIGANTAIFSFINAVMLRSLPVKNPSELVLLGNAMSAGISDGLGDTELYSYPFYREFQRDNTVFTDVAAVFSTLNDVHGIVSGRNDTEPMKVQIVSGTYFPMLGVPAYMGRTLNDDDDKSEGDHPVAVVSYAWWTRSLARDPNVLSRKLKLGDTTFDIVGVAAPEFFGTQVGEAPNIWVPMSMVTRVPPNWGSYTDKRSNSLYLMGRLKPGVTLEQADANVNLLSHQIWMSYRDAHTTQDNLATLAKTQVPLTPMATGLSSLRREFSTPLMILMALVAMVLLIACANIANLLLARSTARAREFAVRQALGAKRSRLIRQLLTESLVLALAGGVLGLAFAVAANRVLLRMVSGGFETLPLKVSIDMRLLLFTFAITVVTALLFGTLPALRATRLELVGTLKDGRGGQGGVTRSPLAKALVISQVAFSLVLLVGAGLFLRSLINLNNVDTGFNKEQVLVLNTDASSIGYKSNEPRLTALYQQIEERVSELHGVTAASFSSFTFHQGSWNGTVRVPGVELDKNIDVKHNVVGEGYFRTMQIPLIAGRSFGPQDTYSSQKVAVISERMAKIMFPKGDAIGRHYHIGGADNGWEMEVIGIVKDVKFGDLAEDPEWIDYVDYSQRRDYLDDFEVRYTGDLDSVSTAVQQAIHGVDRRLPVMRITTLNKQVASSITEQRMVAQLSMFFGLLAVFLSCIGIYGLMSYMVGRRTNEIGIRMALGAVRSDVRWLVMREIVLLIVIGVAIGVPVTLGGSRLVSSMLFGLTGNDLVCLIAAVVTLLVVGLLAGYLPASRASRVDPMVALRYE